MTDWTMPYFDQDEILYERLTGDFRRSVLELCRRARTVAREQACAGSPGRAGALTRSLGVSTQLIEWEVADGRIACLAECTTRPPAISLNRTGIRRLTSALEEIRCEKIANWISERAIIEVVTAHELWHIVTGKASRPMHELAAHSFARELLGMPFSPLLYEEAVRRLLLESHRTVRDLQ